jgi:hypothetical protein
LTQTLTGLARDNIHTHQRGVVNLLKSLQELLGSEERAAFLESAHLHPTGKFPWDQENVLGTLLRKRLEPDIVSWASEGKDAGTAIESDKVDYEELWDWAAVTAIGIGRDVMPQATKDSMDTSEDKTKPVDPPLLSMQELMRFSATGKKSR